MEDPNTPPVSATAITPGAVTPTAVSSALFVLVSGLFFVSGATALGAEIVLNKLLTYVFGSSHMAPSTVLAAYMAGPSAGAWLFGRAVATARRPLRVYALLELLIGAFYALLALGFERFQSFAIGLASPFAAAPARLTLVRFSLSFALVFVPTLMMGGTLPTLVAVFRGSAALEKSLSRLYAVNTLGAAAGTLLASYAAIPALGFDGTLFLCAGLNVAVGALSLVALRRPERPAVTEPETAVQPEPSPPAPLVGPHLPPRAVYALAFSQGALAFVLEVVWAHLIGTVIGVTVYAFSLMLFAILLGIGAGSFLLPIALRRTGRSPATLFIWAMVLLACGVSLSPYGWDRFSVIVGWTATSPFPGFRSRRSCSGTCGAKKALQAARELGGDARWDAPLEWLEARRRKAGGAGR